MNLFLQPASASAIANPASLAIAPSIARAAAASWPGPGARGSTRLPRSPQRGAPRGEP
jgi:hypothetical protein